MQTPAQPTPDSISHAGITWTKFDMRLAGAPEPDLEYCADGEGLFVIKQENEGFFLYQEGLLVKAMGSMLTAAVAQATTYLQSANPTLYKELRAGHGGLPK